MCGRVAPVFASGDLRQNVVCVACCAEVVACLHVKLVLCLVGHKWVSGSPTKYVPFILSLSAFLVKKKKIQKNVI